MALIDLSVKSPCEPGPDEKIWLQKKKFSSVLLLFLENISEYLLQGNTRDHSLPMTPCGAMRSDQVLMSSNWTLISWALLSLSRGSSRSRSTVLKNTVCRLAPASRASQIRRRPSRRILPWCSRNVLDREMLTNLLQVETERIKQH